MQLDEVDTLAINAVTRAGLRAWLLIIERVGKEAARSPSAVARTAAGRAQAANRAVL